MYVLFKLHRQAQKVPLTRVTPDTNILGATVYKYLKEGEETLNRFVWILWPPDANNTNSYFAPSIKWFTPAPLTQTPPPFGHLGETLNMLLQIHTTHKGEKSKPMWPLGLPEGFKKILLSVLNVSFYNVSSIHSTVDKLKKKKKIRCLASHLEPVFYPSPKCSWSLYPCLSVWPVSRGDSLPASGPSVRLGCFTPMASSSPQPDRTEHSMAASWHKAHTKL